MYMKLKDAVKLGTQFMHKGIVIKQGSRLDYDEANRLYAEIITKKEVK